MAYENGYKAEAYIAECMKRYDEDSLMFTKALQVLSAFSQKPTWPHNYFEFENIIEIALGQRLADILRFVAQYLAAEKTQETPKIVWPENTPMNFIKDLVVFYFSIVDIVDMADCGRTAPLRFYGIARSQTHSSTKKVLRIMRMDGNVFDIEVTRNDVKHIIGTLEKMISDSHELYNDPTFE